MGMQNHRLSPTWKKTFVHSIPRNPLVVSTLYSGTHILPQFSSGYLKKGWAPCPGSKCEPYLSSTCFCFFFFQYIAFKKMTRAALIIQNQYRTHREHERFKKSRRAAAIIQNTFRSYRERRRSTQRRREQRLSKRQEARYIQKASNRYLYRFVQGRIYTSSPFNSFISFGCSVFSSLVVWKGLRRNNVKRWPESFSRKLSKVTSQVDVVLWRIERSCHPKLTMMALF